MCETFHDELNGEYGSYPTSPKVEFFTDNLLRSIYFQTDQFARAFDDYLDDSTEKNARHFRNCEKLLNFFEDCRDSVISFLEYPLVRKIT